MFSSFSSSLCCCWSSSVIFFYLLFFCSVIKSKKNVFLTKRKARSKMQKFGWLRAGLCGIVREVVPRLCWRELYAVFTSSKILFLTHYFQLKLIVWKVFFRFGGWRWYCLKTLERKRPVIWSATTPLWITVQLSNPSIHHLIVSLPIKAVIKGKVGHTITLFYFHLCSRVYFCCQFWFKHHLNKNTINMFWSFSSSIAKHCGK